MSVRWVPDSKGEFHWTESDGAIMGLFRDERGYVCSFVIEDFTDDDHRNWTRVKPAGWFDLSGITDEGPDLEPLL